MKLRFLVTVAALVALAVVFTTAPAFAQGSGVKGFKAPRSVDGHADLSGTWTNSTTVPLERPKDLGAKEFYTAEEMAANAKRQAAQAAARAAQAEGGDLAVHYDTAQFALTGPQTKRAPSMRTSLITGPDGRIPPPIP